MTGWTKIKGTARYTVISQCCLRHWLKQRLRRIRMNTGTILVKYSRFDEFLEHFEVRDNEVLRIVTEIEKEMNF